MPARFVLKGAGPILPLPYNQPPAMSARERKYRIYRRAAVRPAAGTPCRERRLLCRTLPLRLSSRPPRPLFPHRFLHCLGIVLTSSLALSSASPFLSSLMASCVVSRAAFLCMAAYLPMLLTLRFSAARPSPVRPHADGRPRRVCAEAARAALPRSSRECSAPRPHNRPKFPSF